MSAKGGARKKWTKATNKEKREFAVIITAEQAADMQKSVPRNKLISPGKLAERYKISLTCARKALESLVADGKIVPVINGHDLKCYGTHPDFVVEKIEEVQQTEKKPSGKKGGKKQQQ